MPTERRDEGGSLGASLREAVLQLLTADAEPGDDPVAQAGDRPCARIAREIDIVRPHACTLGRLGDAPPGMRASGVTVAPHNQNSGAVVGAPEPVELRPQL